MQIVKSAEVVLVRFEYAGKLVVTAAHNRAIEIHATMTLYNLIHLDLCLALLVELKNM